MSGTRFETAMSKAYINGMDDYSDKKIILEVPLKIKLLSQSILTIINNILNRCPTIYLYS